jgi:hypothetical protein
LLSMATVSATAGGAGGGCQAGINVVDSRLAAVSGVIIVAATSGAMVSATWAADSPEPEAAGASHGGLDCEAGSATCAGGELAPAASSASVVPC